MLLIIKTRYLYGLLLDVIVLRNDAVVIAKVLHSNLKTIFKLKRKIT